LLSTDDDHWSLLLIVLALHAGYQQQALSQFAPLLAVEAA